MQVSNTILTTALAIVLAGSSSLLLETQPRADSLSIEASPVIEKAPTGFFVDAPVTKNMTVMIVRVYNDRGEQVLNVRSKGKPVELLASSLPDGEYNY